MNENTTQEPNSLNPNHPLVAAIQAAFTEVDNTVAAMPLSRAEHGKFQKSMSLGMETLRPVVARVLHDQEKLLRRVQELESQAGKPPADQ